MVLIDESYANYGDWYEVSRNSVVIRNRQTTIIVFRNRLWLECVIQERKIKREIERDSDIESVRD